VTLTDFSLAGEPSIRSNFRPGRRLASFPPIRLASLPSCLDTAIGKSGQALEEFRVIICGVGKAGRFAVTQRAWRCGNRSGLFVWLCVGTASIMAR
jgi:hypothetical protein